MTMPSPFGRSSEPASLDVMLRLPQVIRDLGLTERQQAQVKEVAEDGARTRSLMTGQMRPLRPDGDSERFEKARSAFNTKLSEKLDALLSADQKKKLKEMVGKPFTAPLRTERGGFGPP